MTKRTEIAGVHYSHVMITPKCAEMAPLLEVDIVWAVSRPITLHVEQSAQCREVQSFSFALKRLVWIVPCLFIESRHELY